MPFRQFVLKVCSRCDLACDHCYVYEGADQSWRIRPKVIAQNTLTKAVERIAEHAREHGLDEVRVILHGGEPLLAGTERLDQICLQIRQGIETYCRVDLRIHTNGLRLNEDFCELFARHQVKVGISLDGNKSANDRHRRYADGRSSYQQVIAAVGKLRSERYHQLFAGLLCTIDVRNNPVATYDSLASLEPPAIDFLLPHATWDEPPPSGADGGTSYADWLTAIYDRWVTDSRRIPVRVFQSIIATTNNQRSGTEALGLSPSDLMVIETDGSIEQVDSLKVAYQGAPATGYDVFRNSLDEVAAHPGIVARQAGYAGLSEACKGCPVVTSCGGGLYTHRYSSANGFQNPSVYCDDLFKLITHIRSSISAPSTGFPTHAISPATFDSLASGLGDGMAVAALANSQLSIVRGLFGVVRERANGTSSHRAWDVLTDLDQRCTPGLSDVLAHPYVRTWAVRFLPGKTPTQSDVDYLGAVAAAAALRDNLEIDIEVPVRDGFMYLPTLGRLAVGDCGSVNVKTRRGWFEARPSDGPHVVVDVSESLAGWEPIRVLSADEASVRLEDTDPYRNCYEWKVHDRLSDTQFAKWNATYQGAWQLIRNQFPAYAPGLAGGLSTLTPLANGSLGRDISAASRQAYSAVATALPAGSAELALLLMHEFQHVKLGAILEMYQLCDQDDRRLFHAPWREDLRPLEPLLQGTYAHLAVTAFWHGRWMSLQGAKRLDAAARFMHWRDQTTMAADTIANSGSLTPLGVRFVDGMRGTLDGWREESVPAEAASLARTWSERRPGARAGHGAGQ